MSDDSIGIHFNQKMLTFILGVIALGSSASTGIVYFNNQARDLAQLRRDFDVSVQAQTKSNERLSEQVGKLETSVNDLALAVRGLEVIQGRDPLTGQIAIPRSLK